MRYRLRMTSFVVSFVVTASLAACGAEKTPLEKGRTDYLRACAMCHGNEGGGSANLGNPLRDSEFIRTRSDDALVGFLKVGRAPNDPDNESGMPMPPKGGDPRLTDEDLKHIVLFLRTLSPGGEGTGR